MLNYYLAYVKVLVGSKKGQGMVEYGLIIALIAVAVIITLGLLGGQINNLFDKVKNTLVV